MATPKSKSNEVETPNVPRGGAWENHALFGGRRLKDEFGIDEKFILRGLEAGGEIPMEDGKVAVKTQLTVSSMGEPGETFIVTSLGKALSEMADKAISTDFPMVVSYDEVDTKRNLQKAVVLTPYPEIPVPTA